jgi:type III secretion protein T
METLMLKSLQDGQLYIVATAFAISRMSGMILIMPAIKRLGLTRLLKGAAALVFSLPMVPFVAAALAGQQLTAPMLFGLVVKEFAVGVIIGFVLGIPFWAAEIAGDVLDLQRGSSFAGILDPNAGGESTVLSTLLGLTIVALFFVSGGLVFTLQTMYGSYGVWRLTDFLPLFNADAGKLLLGLMDQMMRMGLMLVVPLVMSLLVTDLALALVARSASHMHIFDLSLGVKNLVLIILFVLYAAFLFNYMGIDLRWMLEADTRLKSLL